MSDPSRLTAARAREALASGRLTAEALARDCLARIETRDPQVRAWSHVDPALVLAQARECDRAGRPGKLHGLPVGIKDIILTRDMPTQYNSPLYRGFAPAMDAACVTLLRAAGGVILGKTDTVEFAATGRKALTCNPHDLARTPGGSSSGSAAAVADFHVPLALATQTGGSTIRPASFCGIHAMKPSWNIVSLEGVRRYAVSLDTLGWYGRSSADLALLLDVFDAEPAHQAPVALRGARIALCRTPFWDRAGPDTQAAMQQAEARLASAGAILGALELPPEFADLYRLQMLLMRTEGRGSFLAEYRTDHDRLHPEFRAQVENTDRTTRAELARAYDQAAACRASFDALAARFDAVLTPSTIGPAPLGLANTGDHLFNASWTLLHVPCINLPYFQGEDGLPLGLTLTGPRFSDRRLLAVAESMDALFDQDRGLA